MTLIPVPVGPVGPVTVLYGPVGPGSTEVSARESCLAEPHCTGYAKSGPEWEIYCDQTTPVGTCTKNGNGGTSVTKGNGQASTEPCYVRRCNHF